MKRIRPMYGKILTESGLILDGRSPGERIPIMINRSLLVVDDEPTFLNCLVRDLSSSGLQITTATNGEEGINKINEEFFDLVMTDLSMPVYNGFQVIQAAKQRSRQTMVIVVTGNETTETAVNAFHLGADDFLQKPCDTDELLCRISNCLAKQDLLRKIDCYENYLAICRHCKKSQTYQYKKVGEGIGQTLNTFLHGCCPICLAEHHRDGPPSGIIENNIS
jgi:DNA-binding NtrC family response regulator